MRDVGDHTLTIRELSRETGVAPGTLRMWESRHGFPRPERAGGGHRRYRREDVAIVGEVLRHRSAGLSLSAAIERARDWSPEPERSIFAALRRRCPDLTPRHVSKPVMLAMSRAVEDECLARASHAVLAASFQRAQFYRHARDRWTELAAVADVAFVLADFPRTDARASPARVAIGRGQPAAREWSIACLANDLCACLAGWELPRAVDLPDDERSFEAVWSTDGETVAVALGAAAALARNRAPALADRVDARIAAWDGAGPEQRRAGDAVVARFLGHLSDVA